MLKLSVTTALALLVVASCSPMPVSEWEYIETADKLRGTTVVDASLESVERFGNHGLNPKMVLVVKTGSVEEDRLRITSEIFRCSLPSSIRIDDGPIEVLECPPSPDPYSHNPYYVDVPTDSELAQRILSSEKFVIEIGGANGPQMTFNTKGFDRLRS